MSHNQTSSTWHDPRKRAAVVYDDGVAVASLLRVFAAELEEAGIALGGVLEGTPDGPGCGPGAAPEVSDALTGETIALCRQDSRGRSCSPDAVAAAAVGRRMTLAWSRGAELVFLTRFGRREAAGQGFYEEHKVAGDGDSAVLTAVPRGLADRWLAAHGGTGTLLDARLWVLRQWWRGLRAALDP
jgi:Protein of unknown function (DUF2478)